MFQLDITAFVKFQPNFYTNFYMQLKPLLQPLTGEELCESFAITTNEARCDVSARGFWSPVQVAFLNVRVFNPNPNRYVNQSLKKTYEINEKEKKRAYNERV